MLQSLDTKRGRDGFRSMPDLPYRTPFQRLIAKREKLRPATVLALRIHEHFQVVFRVDSFKASDIVERRNGLGGLKEIAEFSLLVAQAENSIREYRA